MSKAQELSSCPFCGAGETVIHVNQGTWTGRGYGEPVSVEVRHWCKEEPGQPSRSIIRVGRDESSAIAAWNRRSSASSEQQAAQQDAERWRAFSFAGMNVFPKFVFNNGSSFWMYGQHRALSANAVADLVIAARASNGGKA